MSESAVAVAAVPAAGGTPSRRLWEIDALRGVMLIMMTTTHLPTRFSEWFGQPFGFVSAAEGFVMLSGVVAGMVYTQRRLRDGEAVMREAFLQRAAKVYLCQAGLLAFVLGVVAAIGVMLSQPAITNLVAFFIERPVVAVFSGLLLLYNPPLLDILPMYVVFLLVSPVLMLHASRRGWGLIVLASGGLWLAAQFGLGHAGYEALVRLTGMPVPYQQTGAFEILAWQFLWVLGLWIGSAQASGRPAQPAPFPTWAVRFALAFVLLHFVWRHAVGQVPFPHVPTWNLAYDKWQLGPLRMLNFLCLLLLALHYGPALVRRLPRWRTLELWGSASLPVFCAHLVLAMLALAAFGEASPRHPFVLDVALLAGALLALHAVALTSRAVDRQAAAATQRFKEQRAARRLPPTSSRAAPPGLDPAALPVRPEPRSPVATPRTPRG